MPICTVSLLFTFQSSIAYAAWFQPKGVMFQLPHWKKLEEPIISSASGLPVSPSLLFQFWFEPPPGFTQATPVWSIEVLLIAGLHGVAAKHLGERD